VLLETLAVPEQVEPYPSEAAAKRGSTGTAIAPGKTGARAAQEAVEIGQAEAVQGKVAAMLAPVVAALLQAGAAATPGKTAVPLVVPAVRGRFEPCPVGVAMVLVEVAAVQEKAAPTAAPAAVAAARALAAVNLAGAATVPAAAAVPETVGAIVAEAAAMPGRIVDLRAAGSAAAREGAAMAPAGVAAAPGTAGARVVLVVVVPIPAVPGVRAAATPGMTREKLVVETPAAALVLVQMERYLLEETAGAPCVRQRPEAQVYLVEKALAVPYVLHS
jgi:hypothetical protein